MLDRIDDSIVAISSPPGVSARGIIRLSGPAALSLADQTFAAETGRPLSDLPGRTRSAGRVWIGDRGSVPAEAYVFRAPASYTRQDLVELHTVGAPPVLAMLLERLTAAGARPAEPGEFTARAYLSGALNLTEVEGVAALVQARNDAQLRASAALLHGRLSRLTSQIREELADLLALLEAEIDFVEESIEFVRSDQVTATLRRLTGALDGLLRDAVDLDRLDVLPQVMLAGRPNAGKSTLFNRLTGTQRAIPSGLPGTTRDVLSAPLMVPGGEVTLLDSAGLDAPTACAGPRPLDVAALAAAAARRSLAAADLILLVVDALTASPPRVEELRATLPRRPMLVVLNKIDALEEGPPAETQIQADARVSALNGEGVELLRDQIGAAVFTEAVAHGEELLALSGRQRSALAEARAALGRALIMCENTKELKSFAELLTLEVREAMHALSLLVGEVATEDLLARVFSRFCIGK